MSAAQKNVVPLVNKIPLIRYERTCEAIEVCHSVDEVMQHHATAAVMAEAYARIANDVETVRKCQEIQRRAERRCGELLAGMEKAKGGQPYQSQNVTGRKSAAKPLADLGITRQQSSDFQKLAQVPEPVFEKAIAGPGRVPSARDIVAQYDETRRPTGRASVVDAVDPDALWLWGHLKEFERSGVLDKDPNDLLPTMLQHMKETVRELTPRIVAWLERIRS